MSGGTAVAVERPFRGLRYFDEADAHLFFGRDEQVDDLLRTLRRTRFLAVIGSSGSGKSSLVRAGLIPGLRAGFFVEAGGDWRVVVTRPGNAPVAALAADLGAALRLEDAGLTLRRGPLGVVEAVRQADLPPGQHLLLVVDQFEELFRFQREAGDRTQAADEAAFFVKLLLEASARADLPIRVAITMRSDFMGNCAQFRDLPERINDGLYLVPRMRRDQIQQAIVGPLGVVGVGVTPPLVQRLLNDVGDDPDQLPVLQHALLRTWQRWAEERSEDAALDLRHYEKTGGFEHALSDHANEVFESLAARRGVTEGGAAAPGDATTDSPAQPSPPVEVLSPRQRVAKILFQRLVERDAENRDVRRRATVGEVAAVAGAARDEVEEVVEAFAADGVWLLAPSGDLLDITHESLIRKWDRITGTRDRKGWLTEEVEAKDALVELATRASRLATPACEALVGERLREGPLDPARGASRVTGLGQAFEDVLRGSELDRALEARKAWAPWPWADRYVGDDGAFARTLLFIDASLEAREARQRIEERARADLERDRERQRRRAYAIAAGALGLALVFAVLAFFVWRFKTQADEQRAQSAQQAANLRTSTIVYGAVAALPRDPTVSALLLGEIRPEGAPWIALQVASDTAREGIASAVLRGHNGPVLDAAFSPDGTRIVTASTDGTARVWPADGTGQPLILSGHEDRVLHAVFSPDGTRIATASSDGTVRVWPAGGGEARMLPAHAAGVAHIEFSPDGRQLLTVSLDRSRAALVWPAGGSDEPIQLGGGAHVTAAAFSPDGTRVATAGDDGFVRIWCADGSCAPVAVEGARGTIDAVSLSPDGRYVLSVGDEGIVVSCVERPCAPTRVAFGLRSASAAFVEGEEKGELLVAGATGRSIFATRLRPAEAGGRGPVAAPAWSPGLQDTTVVASAASPRGRLLATVTRDGVVRIWPLGSNPARHRIELRGHAGAVSSVAFDRDGDRVVTASADGTARVWRTDGAGEPVTIADASGGGFDYWLAENVVPNALVAESRAVAMTRVAFSPDGSLVATGSPDSTVRVWRVEDGSLARQLGGRGVGVRAIVFSPDGRLVASAPEDWHASIWAAAGDDAERRLEGHGDRLLDVTFDISGGLIATASRDRTARIWGAGDGREVAVLKGHEGAVTRVRFDPSGRQVVTASEDRTARVWTVDGVQRHLLQGHAGPVVHAAFSAGGARVVTASLDGTARVWRLGGAPALPDRRSSPGTPPPVGEPVFVTLKGHTGGVVDAAFSPDGARVVTASDDGTARVWESETGREMAVLNGHVGPVWEASFSPDGARVITASSDGTARVWQADGAGEAMVLRGHGAAVMSARFNADGTRVASASIDGTARVWRVGLGPLLGLLRSATATVCLQPAERRRFLRESADVAMSAFEACERGHGRMVPEAAAPPL